MLHRTLKQDTAWAAPVPLVQTYKAHLYQHFRSEEVDKASNIMLEQHDML